MTTEYMASIPVDPTNTNSSDAFNWAIETFGYGPTGTRWWAYGATDQLIFVFTSAEDYTEFCLRWL